MRYERLKLFHCTILELIVRGFVPVARIPGGFVQGALTPLSIDPREFIPWAIHPTGHSSQGEFIPGGFIRGSLIPLGNDPKENSHGSFI